MNRIEFEIAFELNSYERTACLATETGAVIFVKDYVVHQLKELLTDEDSKDVEAVLQTIPNWPSSTANRCWVQRESRKVLIIIIG